MKLISVDFAVHLLINQNRGGRMDDRYAAQIRYGMFDLAQGAGVSVLPVYTVSHNPAAAIVDVAATLGVDMLMLGAPHRHSLATLLRGDIVNEVAKNLPDNNQLIIHA